MRRIDRFDSLILFYAELNGILFERAKRQMVAESRGDPHIVSPAGAIGLFQLMPATAKELGVDPNDIEGNVKGGTLYQALQIRQVQRFLGSYQAGEEDVYRMALAAYNAGAGYVMVAIQAIRKKGVTATWEHFLPALAQVRFKGKRPDWRRVDGYVHEILPPPLPIA